MNNVMIKIGGRDALPLRAIPYVTNWQESSDSLVRVLAAPKTNKFCGKNIRIKHSELFAYRADDEGDYAQINHKQWERSVLAIDNLTGVVSPTPRNFPPTSIRCATQGQDVSLSCAIDDGLGIADAFCNKLLNLLTHPRGQLAEFIHAHP